MALEVADWTKLIRSSVDRISDKLYQDRSWFSGGKEVSSPDEIFSELFDDLDFDNYLRSGDISLTKAQRAAGELLKARMNDYAGRTEIFLDPRLVIEDPAWYEI